MIIILSLSPCLPFVYHSFHSRPLRIPCKPPSTQPSLLFFPFSLYTMGFNLQLLTKIQTLLEKEGKTMDELLEILTTIRMIRQELFYSGEPDDIEFFNGLASRYAKNFPSAKPLEPAVRRN